MGTWAHDIEKNPCGDTLILLLASADFLASDYCSAVVMQKALETQRQGKALVLAVLLRLVDWQDALPGKIQIIAAEARRSQRRRIHKRLWLTWPGYMRGVVDTLRTHKN